MKVTKEFLTKLIKEEVENEVKKGPYDSMTHGLENMGAKSYIVSVEDHRGIKPRTFNHLANLVEYLARLEDQGIDLYDVDIRPVFK